jgi:hypothetical protein
VHFLTLREGRLLLERGRHEFAGVPAIFAEVKAGHKYSKRTLIPARRSPGRYTVRGRCGGDALGVTAHLRVVAY